MAQLPTGFGKYFLTEKLATGGMAEIYLAKLIGPGGFEKQLVIKQIHPELGKERTFVDLFVTEAKTLVGLSHGNIVPIYELGVVDDTYFIAMEYIDGPTLAALLGALGQRGRTMEPAMAAFVASELLKGLDYAHRKGDVVHRDLSPRNVLLSRDGEVKLVDFGIAIAGGGATSGAAGRPVGSFPYMSPEQVRLEPLDGQSDLFAAGVLLWEMLTGRPLFARPDADATLAAVLEAEIEPPSRLVPGLPAALDDMCLKALARAKADRFATAAAFQAGLGRYLYTLDPPIGPSEVSRLVATACPPGPRPASESAADELTPPPAEADDLSIDRTRPMERAHGKPRAGTVRTFATSAHFEKVLANATPLFPIEAITDAEAIIAARPLPVTAPNVPSDDAAETATMPRTRRQAPALIAGAVVLALGATLAVTWQRHRGHAAPGPRPLARVADAGPVTARPIDAAPPPIDAAPPPIDAAPRHPTRDAGARVAPSRPPGTLEVGANPWADVSLDGVRLGQAPGAWSVAAGPHTVELRFHDAVKRFKVDVASGKTTSLGLVDFTAP